MITIISAIIHSSWLFSNNCQFPHLHTYIHILFLFLRDLEAWVFWSNVTRRPIIVIISSSSKFIERLLQNGHRCITQSQTLYEINLKPNSQWTLKAKVKSEFWAVSWKLRDLGWYVCPLEARSMRRVQHVKKRARQISCAVEALNSQMMMQNQDCDAMSISCQFVSCCLPFSA